MPLDPQAKRVGHDPQRFDQIVVVVEWLAHTHENDIRERSITVALPHMQQLADHFAHREVALQTHGTGGTEVTPKRATRL